MVGSRQIRLIIFGFAVTAAIVNVQAATDADRAKWARGGDAAAQSFEEYCWRLREFTSKGQAAFYAELDNAERSLASRNTIAAKRTLRNALAAINLGRDDDLSVKCLGEAAARRWLTAQLTLQRLAPDNRLLGKWVDGALYLAAADHGTDGIIEVVSAQTARQFKQSIPLLERIVSEIERLRKFGTFMLPEEDAIAKASQAALGPLRKQAWRKHEAALAAEDQAFSRPATEQEIAMLDAMSGVEAFASEMMGIENNAAAQKEVMLIGNRVDKSRKLLRSASAWDLKRYDNTQSRPTSQRARKRGDMMLAKANDTKFSLEARDQLYKYAIAYYKFGGWDIQARKSTSARDAIQPALQAEQARQRAAREKAREKFQNEMAIDAEQLEQAQKKMMKSEAEKQSFKDEADALEAELDF